MATDISATVTVKVRFSELDPLGVVWHGNYVKYLEDAREEFGRKWGLEYMTIFSAGYYAPVFDMKMRFMQPARVDDVLEVECSYRPAVGAKLCFDYTVRRKCDSAVILTASSIQLFTSVSGEFEPSEPEFFSRWKNSLPQGE